MNLLHEKPSVVCVQLKKSNLLLAAPSPCARCSSFAQTSYSQRTLTLAQCAAVVRFLVRILVYTHFCRGFIDAFRLYSSRRFYL